LAHKANHTINFFCGKKFPMLQSQHINLCPEMQLAERLTD